MLFPDLQYPETRSPREKNTDRSVEEELIIIRNKTVDF